MDVRAEALAARFEQVNNAAIATIERCSVVRKSSGARCPDEERSVAVTAPHIATSHAGLARIVAAIAEGATLPPVSIAKELIDERNERNARLVRGLSDDQLTRTTAIFGGQPLRGRGNGGNDGATGQPAGSGA